MAELNLRVEFKLWPRPLPLLVSGPTARTAISPRSCERPRFFLFLTIQLNSVVVKVRRSGCCHFCCGEIPSRAYTGPCHSLEISENTKQARTPSQQERKLSNQQSELHNLSGARIHHIEPRHTQTPTACAVQPHTQVTRAHCLHYPYPQREGKRLPRDTQHWRRRH